ncbi:MAG TPA: PadR family transcriptional regulator [Acidimicrobiales bacterium]|nr:PadR family transcriptional regulator [Acidimicrobiales bacterium]
MSKRKIGNPLALVVLACLIERPMHPYEMATTMRSRAKHESIKLNYGSLYTVVQSLERLGLIEAHETEREGKRPERTVYTITDAGRMEYVDWLSELLSTPEREYTTFEAGLALLPGLPPDDVADLLEQRCRNLEITLAQLRAADAAVSLQEVPKVFRVEFDFRVLRTEAELAFTANLVGEICSGSLGGLDEWRSFHAESSPETAPLGAARAGPAKPGRRNTAERSTERDKDK